MRLAALRISLLLTAALADAALRVRHLDVGPDLVVVVLTVIGLSGGVRAGVACGLLAGWCVDLIPPGPAVLGVAAMSYALAGALAGRARRLDRVPLAWVALVAAGAAAVVVGIALLGDAWSGAPLDLGASLGTVVLTAVLAAPLAPVLLAVERRLKGRPR